MTETIEEARARLCAKCEEKMYQPKTDTYCCSHRRPDALDSTGEDCPYFEEEKSGMD